MVGGIFGLFADNARGRIDPAGEFKNKTGNAEYFVGSVWSGRVRVNHVEHEKLVVEGNLVCINFVLHFSNYANTTTNVPIYVYNLTQTGCFYF